LKVQMHCTSGAIPSKDNRLFSQGEQAAEASDYAEINTNETKKMQLHLHTHCTGSIPNRACCFPINYAREISTFVAAGAMNSNAAA